MANEFKTADCKGCGLTEAEAAIVDGFCFACCTVPVHKGYTRADLWAAFDLVKPQSGNWKDPIKTTLKVEGGMVHNAESVQAVDAAIGFYCKLPDGVDAGGVIVQAVDAAIGFYCGEQAKFVFRYNEIEVTAPGYYALIGA